MPLNGFFVLPLLVILQKAKNVRRSFGQHNTIYYHDLDTKFQDIGVILL
jgi:hypothetical protein